MVARNKSSRPNAYGFKIAQVKAPPITGEKDRILHLYEVYLTALGIRQSSIDGFVKQAQDRWATEKESSALAGLRAVVKAVTAENA